MTARELLIRAYNPRNATDDEYVALHQFFEQVDREERPLDPPVSLALFVARRRHLVPVLKFACWAAWDGAAIVAETGCWTYEMGDNARAAEFAVWVLPAYRRQGLGRRLLGLAAQSAAGRGRDLMIGRTTSTVPAGEAFMQRLGAKPGLPAHTNQLALAEADPSLLRRWLAHGEQRAGEFELGWWVGPYPEADLAAIVDLWKVMNQAPQGDLEKIDFSFTVDQLREMDATLKERELVRWSVYIRERATGVLAGFSETFWEPERPEIIYQGNTGVFPQYRNRGLGRWLKAAMVERVLRERPAARFIRTDNADMNAPMLKINTQLGFKPYLAQTLWQMEVAQVRAYLGISAEAPLPSTG